MLKFIFLIVYLSLFGIVTSGFSLEIYLVRHGQTDPNVDELQSQLPNTPLNQIGKEQARVVGQELSALNINSTSKIYASDYVRAVQTAQIIASECNDNISIDLSDKLREGDWGNWRVKTASEKFQLRKQARQSYGQTRDAWVSYKGDGSVESYAQMHERLKNFLTNSVIPDIHTHELPENTSIVLVSHGLFIIATLYHLLEYNPKTGFRIDNCGWIKLKVANDGTITFIDSHKIDVISLVD